MLGVKNMNEVVCSLNMDELVRERGERKAEIYTDRKVGITQYQENLSEHDRKVTFKPDIGRSVGVS